MKEKEILVETPPPKFATFNSFNDYIFFILKEFLNELKEVKNNEIN